MVCKKCGKDVKTYNEKLENRFYLIKCMECNGTLCKRRENKHNRKDKIKTLF